MLLRRVLDHSYRVLFANMATQTAAKLAQMTHVIVNAYLQACLLQP